MFYFSPLQEGRVIAVNVQLRRLTVELASGQIVHPKTLHYGPADGARVSHKALPARGTWGLVAFPSQDDRNCIWLGAFYPMFMDALTTNTDQFLEYDSHWSGAYELLDQQGQWTKSFPDGTFIQVSASTSKPATYRHTVDQNQNQQLTLFPDSERIANPPSSPYNVVVNHPSGASILIDTNGNVTVTAANGKQLEATANEAWVTITDSGAIEVNVAGGQQLYLSAGNGDTQYTLVRTDLLVAWLNGHTHTNGNQGSPTGTPIQALSNSTIQSELIDISE